MDTTINIGEFGGTIAALMIVGAILKNAFPNFPNRLIPLCTWILGIAAYQTMVGGWSDPKQWLAAVIAAASATGVHSGIKNTMADSKATTGVITLLLVCGLSMSVFTGCGTTAQKIYQAEGVIITSVDTGMQMWADRVADGRANQAQVDSVKDAYNKYYVSQQVAKAAFEKYLAGKMPNDLEALKTANASARDAEKALLDLINNLFKL